jgi:hypothetical protein
MDIPMNLDGTGRDFAALERAMRHQLSHGQPEPGIQRFGLFVRLIRTRNRLSIETLARQADLDWVWLTLLEEGLLSIADVTPERVQTLGRSLPLADGVARPDLFGTLAADLLDHAAPSPRQLPRGESLVETVVRWLSPVWHPPLAGERVTAADVDPDERVFYLDEGSIQLSCRWRAATPSQPPSLWVSWSTEVLRPGELRVRFLRRDDPSIVLGEQTLGHHPSGEMTWSMFELGFDPTRDPWSIVLVLTD